MKRVKRLRVNRRYSEDFKQSRVKSFSLGVRNYELVFVNYSDSYLGM